MSDQALEFDDKQRLAFSKLNAAFIACDKAGIDIWGELETFYAVSRDHLNGRDIVSGRGYEVTENAEAFTPKCFKGCSGDDGLSFC